MLIVAQKKKSRTPDNQIQKIIKTKLSDCDLRYVIIFNLMSIRQQGKFNYLLDS